ncbi:MAG: hypothetical protein AABZ08_06010 [Planctomycetota bacterium]
MSKPQFRELITPFLQDRMAELRNRFGEASVEYEALARQYVYTEEEQAPAPEANLRHYEADIGLQLGNEKLLGVERLYRRTLVIEPTLACAAHCRYCIRANYPRNNLSEDQLTQIARFCGSPENRDDLREILVTGGDVLLVPEKVNHLLRAVIEHAPNIRVARIATRIPVQEPARIAGEVLRIFEDKAPLRVELATQINHRVELCDETIAAYHAIMDRGARVYAQNVLLRGVNDRIDSLVDLYDALRDLGIESHYLFHCVPLRGMGHLRTGLLEAIELGRQLTCAGGISGRAKPMVAAMTDIGKIVLYDGTVLHRNDRHVLLQSDYTLDERLRWNPNWTLPDTAEVDATGRLRVWYLDGPEAESLSKDHGDTVSNHLDRSRYSLPVMRTAG